MLSKDLLLILNWMGFSGVFVRVYNHRMTKRSFEDDDRRQMIGNKTLGRWGQVKTLLASPFPVFKRYLYAVQIFRLIAG